MAAQIPGSGVPTKTVTFYDGTQALGEVPLNSAGVATLSTSLLLPGAHTLSAEYSGDGNFLGSISKAVSATIGFTSCITGTYRGNLTVDAGQTVCVTGKVLGGVDVHGGAIAILGGTVTGGVSGIAPSGVLVCGGQVGGAVNLQGAVGLVLVGGLSYCPSNALDSVLISGATNQIEVVGNTVKGAITIVSNTGSPLTIQGNEIGGALSCIGNSASPVDNGDPNSVRGSASNQCSGLV